MAATYFQDADACYRRMIAAAAPDDQVEGSS